MTDQNQPFKAIQVAWCSPMEMPKNLPGDFEVFQLTIPIFDRAIDLILFDIEAFAGLEEIRNIYETLGYPNVLVVVDTIEQETTALAWLHAKDDICRRDAIQQQIGWRLKRCCGLGNQKIDRDPLTSIANRRSLDNHVKALLGSNPLEESFCLIFLNIDRFKSINDRYGHTVGDEILQELAQLLQEYSRGVEIVARYGGEQFAIALRGSLAQGEAFAEFLRTQIATHPFCTEKSPIHTSASFGVAATHGDLTFEELVNKTDRCLYAAKKLGRNRTVTAEEFDASADAIGQDIQITAFENKIRVITERMTEALVLNARRLAKQYRTEADLDGLTEVFNRRYFDRLLSRQLEEFYKQDKPLTLALLDLDHFGLVNKTYGFPTGDRALKIAIEAVRGCVRETDWIARYGGEEFCVVMPNTSLKEGVRVGERIRETVKEKTVEAYDGRKFQITASIGIVERLPEDADLIALCQRASDKVREAKEGGRDRVKF
ncbi:diguanylate cyclase [Lusitaniella coriacea]|uniref:diguanylate cyclase n=1 Tax=Lusitaniella coriacea TaxID=1983105 RepID=UPI003CF94120